MTHLPSRAVCYAPCTPPPKSCAPIHLHNTWHQQTPCPLPPTPPRLHPHPHPHPTPSPPPGLRNLQARQQLQDLVSFVCAARDNLPWGPRGPPPLLVKVAPDLSDGEKADVAAVVLASRVDGLVVGNTTISRPGGCWKGVGGGGQVLA